jgi:pimeloyl-ACP methyl ester carboxylesterase
LGDNVTKGMKLAVLDGVSLEYELCGAGEPVVLIHWGVGAAWAAPLLGEPALADHYLLLAYHRAGYAGSGRIDGSIGIAEHARHCRLLLAHLSLERAHVVGHSSSALVALQLALDSPDVVQTLALLESARPVPPTEVQAAFVREFVQPALSLYHAGDRVAAVDMFLQGVFGPGYRSRLDRRLPDGFDQAVADADAFFGQELPALQAWSFGEEDARRVVQPVLLVLGERTTPTFPERRDLLLSWLPNAEQLDLAGTSHLLHVENPAATAEGLASFFARHPVSPPG